MLSFTPLDFIVLVFALAGVSTLQFFKGRKQNLALIALSSRILEETIKPRDKEYQWIGIYVGYHAVYKVYRNGVDRVEATVTLIPRLSLFYYPIALVTSRFDRFYLKCWLSKTVPGEAHVVRKGFYRKSLKKVIKGSENMEWREVSLGGSRYTLIYRSRVAAKMLRGFLENLENPELVGHAAIVPRDNVVYVAGKLDVFKLRDIAGKALQLAMRV